MMEKRIQILDSTLRDGGLGFEDGILNGISDKSFSVNNLKDITDCLCASKVDIIELGSIESSKEDKRRFAIYQNIESISKMIPKKRPSGQMFAALYRGPDTPLKDIPAWNSSYCEAVRIIIRYSELQKSLDFCKGLSQKGYKVFVQPGVTARYSENEMKQLINSANDMDAYALYFVDSYGYMQRHEVNRFFKRYDAELKPSIKIGFHAHNNMSLAFSNALEVISQKSDRNIIIDSCIMGLGQGAGNLQTELIIGQLNLNQKSDYQYDSILQACEIVEGFWGFDICGYSVARLLPALYRTAYKYSVIMRKKYGLSFVEINNILRHMPEDMRQRYTRENLVKLLEQFGHYV